MNSRLLQIIQYKTGGHQSAFAALIGWTPQYLAKLVRGINFGLRPVMAIATALPEVNLRWLLLGEGEMLETGRIVSLENKVASIISSLFDFDRYIRFMSADELSLLEQSLGNGIIPSFSDARIAEWKQKATSREIELNKLFLKSINESCNHQTRK